MPSLSFYHVQTALNNGHTAPKGWTIDYHRYTKTSGYRRITLFLGDTKAATLLENNSDHKTTLYPVIKDDDFVAEVTAIFADLSTKGKNHIDQQRRVDDQKRDVEHAQHAETLRAAFKSLKS